MHQKSGIPKPTGKNAMNSQDSVIAIGNSAPVNYATSKVAPVTTTSAAISVPTNSF